jgi:hypothetical protein
MSRFNPSACGLAAKLLGLRRPLVADRDVVATAWEPGRW